MVFFFFLLNDKLRNSKLRRILVLSCTPGKHFPQKGENHGNFVILLLCPEAMIKWRVVHPTVNVRIVKQWRVERKASRPCSQVYNCDRLRYDKTDLFEFSHVTDAGSHRVGWNGGMSIKSVHSLWKVKFSYYIFSFSFSIKKIFFSLFFIHTSLFLNVTYLPYKNVVNL